jgi:hypothetical protein
LIVIKHVVNDNGGTAVAGDFSMSTGGTNANPADGFAGEESPGTTVTLDAGSYNVTETGPSGYTALFSTDCSGSIAVGETKTCTVTNDDIAVPHVSQITPTATTCAQFKAGTAGTLSRVDYSVRNGNISQVSPGVFFYWVTVSSSGTYTIDQTITTGNFSTLFTVASGSSAFNSSCTKVSTTITQNPTTGAVTVTFAGSGSTFYIGIKYSTGSVVGKAAPSPTTVHYDFSTVGVAGSTSGIDLKKKGTP